jgi:hypothetical protein
MIKDIEECCKLETDYPDAELMRTDTKAFVSKIRKENPDISDIEIGVHIGLLEKADSIMAIIKKEEICYKQTYSLRTIFTNLVIYWRKQRKNMIEKGDLVEYKGYDIIVSAIMDFPYESCNMVTGIKKYVYDIVDKDGEVVVYEKGIGVIDSDACIENAKAEINILEESENG